MSEPAASDGIAAFVAGPATAAAAAALLSADAGSLADLVATLESAGKRAHLEALGRSRLPKALRKAAKRAAYALKSAGVEEEAVRAGGVDLSTTVGLDELALVGAPGLSARYQVMLAELPDAEPLALEIEAWGGAPRVTVLDKLSHRHLDRYRRGLEGESTPGQLVVGSAALAIRMAERAGEAIRHGDGSFPPSWDRVLWWCDRARALGATPEIADARAQLGEAGRSPSLDLQRTTARLFELPISGAHAPATAALTALLTQVAEAAESRLELTRAQFIDRLEGLADAACDAFFGNAEAQQHSARALEGSADVLLHAGERDGAVQCLWLADQLATGASLPHELGLLSASFRRIISYDAAWERHLEVVGGEAEAAAPSLIETP